MKSNINDEPSLEKIDDFNDKEPKEKRNIVKLVVIFCLVVGAVLAYMRSTSTYSDYVGTEDKPGITTTKK
jgi:hypothetical protein